MSLSLFTAAALRRLTRFTTEARRTRRRVALARVKRAIFGSSVLSVPPWSVFATAAAAIT